MVKTENPGVPCSIHGLGTFKSPLNAGFSLRRDVAKMRALEDENRRLKRIVADQALHLDTLKIAASGNY